MTKKKENTKKVSRQQYYNTYAGPSFEIHYKYSTILNIVFITMMFGYGVPMLFPLAIGQLAVLYVVEVLSLYYSYREPPMQDARLPEYVLNIMDYAPLFYFGFGWWMASSRQLLSNDHLTPSESLNSSPISSHNLTSLYTEVGWASPAWPLLLSFIIMVFLIIFKTRILHQFKDEDIDEDIPNYFASLDHHDREWQMGEERQIRNFKHFKKVERMTNS